MHTHARLTAQKLEAQYAAEDQRVNEQLKA
jgi:hypothetical protein